MRLTSGVVIVTGVEVRRGKPDENGEVREFRQVTAVGVEGDGGGLLPVTVQVPRGVAMPERGACGRMTVDAIGGMRVVGEARSFAVPVVDSLRLVKFEPEPGQVAGAKS